MRIVFLLRFDATKVVVRKLLSREILEFLLLLILFIIEITKFIFFCNKLYPLKMKIKTLIIKNNPPLKKNKKRKKKKRKKKKNKYINLV